LLYAPSELVTTYFFSHSPTSFSNIGGACVVVHRGARLNLLDGNACMESWEEDGAGTGSLLVASEMLVLS